MRNKILSGLLSIVIAFGLWLYVITVDSPDYKDTIYDIPVTFANETAMNDKGFILTGTPYTTVDLTLSGKRSEVIKCNRSNITVKVDLNKIYEAGNHNLEYSITYPADVASNAITEENKYPGTISVFVEKWSRKEVPVNVVCVGTVPEYRRQGIGLKMVQNVTQILKEKGYALGYIHYTGVGHWYAKLGYQTLVKWNSGGIIR